MLNNGLLFSIIMYLDIFSFHKIKNINRFTFKLYNNNKYCYQLKLIYNTDENLETSLKYINFSLNNFCFLCNTFIENNKVLIIHNILPEKCKCFMCYKDQCECTMYMSAHRNCLSQFEKRKFNNKIRRYVIHYLSDNFINGLII